MRTFETETKIRDLKREIGYWFETGTLLFDYHNDGSNVTSSPRIEFLRRKLEKLEKLRDRENSMSEWG